MKRRISLPVLLGALVLGGLFLAKAFESITFNFSVDFTDAKAAHEKAEWTHAEALDITKAGLGYDDHQTAGHGSEILTCPLAIGRDWRPAIAAGVNVRISPAPLPTKDSSGRAYTPHGGIMYVRYSPDRKHWSSWQRLEESDTQKDVNFLSFHGNVGVPLRDREQYGNLLNEYRRLDVPWGEDEAATVRWIVGRQPEFLANNLPFVGYLQFLYEVDFTSGQRLRSLEAVVSGGVSGLQRSSPKDPTAKSEREGPWSYVSP